MKLHDIFSFKMTIVSLNRCICVHSMAQIVDIIFQNLLYQHQFIPEPMQQLISNGSSTKAILEYHRVCLLYQFFISVLLLDL